MASLLWIQDRDPACTIRRRRTIGAQSTKPEGAVFCVRTVRTQTVVLTAGANPVRTLGTQTLALTGAAKPVCTVRAQTVVLMCALKGRDRKAQGGGSRASGIRNPGYGIDLGRAL